MKQICNFIKVNDLLCKDGQKGGLQVRQHPSQGYFYAQNLKKIPVGSYKEIESRIDEGTANRTVASTNMNATSSRVSFIYYFFKHFQTSQLFILEYSQMYHIIFNLTLLIIKMVLFSHKSI
jgi:hypothetical protein